MSRKRHSAAEILNNLRQGEMELGGSVPEVCRLQGVTEATYYWWRRVYGG